MVMTSGLGPRWARSFLRPLAVSEWLAPVVVGGHPHHRYPPLCWLSLSWHGELPPYSLVPMVTVQKKRKKRYLHLYYWGLCM